MCRRLKLQSCLTFPFNKSGVFLLCCEITGCFLAWEKHYFNQSFISAVFSNILSIEFHHHFCLHPHFYCLFLLFFFLYSFLFILFFSSSFQFFHFLNHNHDFNCHHHHSHHSLVICKQGENQTEKFRRMAGQLDDIIKNEVKVTLTVKKVISFDEVVG